MCLCGSAALPDRNSWWLRQRPYPVTVPLPVQWPFPHLHRVVQKAAVQADKQEEARKIVISRSSPSSLGLPALSCFPHFCEDFFQVGFNFPSVNPHPPPLLSGWREGGRGGRRACRSSGWGRGCGGLSCCWVRCWCCCCSRLPNVGWPTTGRPSSSMARGGSSSPGPYTTPGAHLMYESPCLLPLRPVGRFLPFFFSLMGSSAAWCEDVERAGGEGQGWRSGCGGDLCFLGRSWAISWQGAALSVFFLLFDAPFLLRFCHFWSFLWQCRQRVLRVLLSFACVPDSWLSFACLHFLQYNFEGRYNLVRFVKTARDAGLYVVLRVGPYVCAEWNFGYPPPRSDLSCSPLHLLFRFFYFSMCFLLTFFRRIMGFHVAMNLRSFKFFYCLFFFAGGFLFGWSTCRGSVLGLTMSPSRSAFPPRSLLLFLVMSAMNKHETVRNYPWRNRKRVLPF